MLIAPEEVVGPARVRARSQAVVEEQGQEPGWADFSPEARPAGAPEGQHWLTASAQRHLQRPLTLCQVAVQSALDVSPTVQRRGAELVYESTPEGSD